MGGSGGGRTPAFKTPSPLPPPRGRGGESRGCSTTLVIQRPSPLSLRERSGVRATGIGSRVGSDHITRLVDEHPDDLSSPARRGRGGERVPRARAAANIPGAPQNPRRRLLVTSQRSAAACGRRRTLTIPYSHPFPSFCVPHSATFIPIASAIAALASVARSASPALFA